MKVVQAKRKEVELAHGSKEIVQSILLPTVVKPDDDGSRGGVGWLASFSFHSMQTDAMKATRGSSKLSMSSKSV